MRRILFAGLIDDHVQLSGEQHTAVHAAVMELFGRERGANVVRVAPGMLALAAIPLWQHLGGAHGTLVNAVAQGIFATLVVLLIWWMFRRAYMRHARAAVRELGLADICAHCGYDLSQQAENRERCPECGRVNAPFNAGP